MKTFKNLRLLLLAILLSPAVAFAQNYNNTYSFVTPYQNSIHTCGVQVTNSEIVEGGTVDYPNFPIIQKVVELGRVNSVTGIMFSPPFLYSSTDGIDHEAVDLVESNPNANWAVVLSNIFNPFTGLNRIGVFETDPGTGFVSWALTLGNNLNISLYGAAITKDPNGDYYVYGYTWIAGGTRMMYMARINTLGVVIWENVYPSGSATDDFESIDLLFDNNNNILIVTANFYNPSPNGIIVADVNPATGVMGMARHIPIMDGTPDFQVRDMSLQFNGNYALVGTVNSSPIHSWLIQYLPGLVPFGPFKLVYYASPDDIIFTGVQPSSAGGMYVSYDRTPGGVLTPSIVQMDMFGTPLSTFYYTQPGYVGSRGLIAVNGNTDWVIKGAVDATGYAGNPSLSLVGIATPLAFNFLLCNDTTKIKFVDEFDEEDLIFHTRRRQTFDGMDIIVEKLKGKMFDCYGSFLGYFKLAAPTTDVEEKAVTATINVYPNPNNGNMTIELNEDAVAMYQTGEIFNALGEVVKTFNVTGQIERIDISNQTPGIYLLRLKAGNGNVSESMRIMVK